MEQPADKWQKTLWAKTGEGDQTHLLIYHLIDVAEVAHLLWEHTLGKRTRAEVSQTLGLSEEQAGRFLAFVIGLHDLGKASPAFQRKYEPIIPLLQAQGLPFGFGQVDVPHGIMTTVSLGYKGHGLLIDSGMMERGIAIALARVIGGHHGVWPHNTALHDAYDALSAPWEDARERLFVAYRDLYQPPLLPASLDLETKALNAFLVMLSGFTTIADWLGSMSDYFPLEQAWIPLDAYRQRARQQAEDALRETGWLRDTSDARPLSLSDLLPDPSNEPNPVQQAVLAHTSELSGQALILIEAPTGIGKTEIAFHLCSQLIDRDALRGLYIAMPTQATSNQMHTRTTRYLQTRYPRGNWQPRLLHSQAAWQMDQKPLTPTHVYEDRTEDRTGTEVNWFVSNKKRGLLEPFAVGTVDQALLSVLWTRHFFVRLFGLRHKVLIFDEVHAYDTYMNELFMTLLGWMHRLGSSVIILSATLPNTSRCKLVEQFGGQISALDDTALCNTRLTLVSGEGDTFAHSLDAATQQREVRIEWLAAESLLATLEDATREGGCVAILCNTVGHAQEQYRTLQEAQEGGGLANCELYLFHARTPAAWREKTEHDVTERFGRKGPRPQRAILVATQVIEQSLDLDFDLLITELPPIDLLIQRIGRLHRHARPDRPVLLREPHVLILEPAMQEGLPAFGDSEFVYDRFLLLASWAALQGRDRLCLPDQSRELIETVYGEDWQALPWGEALAQVRPIYATRQGDSEYHASLKHIPPPAEKRLLDGQNTGLDEDDPTLHEAFRALTREIEPTVQVICLHQVEAGTALEPDGSEPVDLKRKPDPRRLLRYTVSIGKKAIFNALCTRPEYDLPPAWKSETALKHHRVAVFENSRCQIAGTRYILRLTSQYGLEIRKEDD